MTLTLPQNDKEAVHYDPQKFGRLKDDVLVLRKVNVKKLQRRETPTSSTAWELIGAGQVQLHLREDALPWYEQGLIINDQPRDERVARDIVRATIGFAVARTDTGEILETFGPDGLGQAKEVAASAKLVITPRVQRVAPAVEDDDEALLAQFMAEHQGSIEDATPEANQEA